MVLNKVSPDVIEDRVRQALKDLSYIDDLEIDLDDYNTGEPFIHIHISLDPEY